MRVNLIRSLIALSFFALIACGEKEQPKVENTQTEMNQMPNAALHNVKVLEKMNASSYSYLKVSENNKDYWIAVPQMEVQPGDMISYSKFMEMKDFKSETLNKTFESVLFVDDARKSDGNNPIASPHSNVATPKNESIKVEPLKDGYTIEKLYAKKNDLVNKTIKVKGVVVKINENIMDMNWIHIQDGTGSGSDHDLLITTKTPAKVGQTIVAEGKVITNKDFGAGYFYPVLLEDAKVTVQ